MTEQEQIEKAFNEFTSKYDLYGNEWQDMGCDELFKAGWLAAKRSQKPVELPNSRNIFFDTVSQESGFISAIEYVSEILEESGITYTVKGE